MQTVLYKPSSMAPARASDSPNQDDIRIQHVANHASQSNELRVVAQAEIDAAPLAGDFFHQGEHFFFMDPGMTVLEMTMR